MRGVKEATVMIGVMLFVCFISHQCQAVEIRYPKKNLMPENELTVMGWFYYAV